MRERGRSSTGTLLLRTRREYENLMSRKAFFFSSSHDIISTKTPCFVGVAPPHKAVVLCWGTAAGHCSIAQIFGISNQS